MVISIAMMLPATAQEGFALNRPGTYGIIFGIFSLAVALYLIRLQQQYIALGKYQDRGWKDVAYAIIAGLIGLLIVLAVARLPFHDREKERYRKQIEDLERRIQEIENTVEEFDRLKDAFKGK